MAAEGLQFLSEHTDEVARVSWLWSINYALLSFFEFYDSKAKVVHVGDWNDGDRRARVALRYALNAHPRAAWCFMFFDSDSPEQEFITALWSSVAPVPTNSQKIIITRSTISAKSCPVGHRPHGKKVLGM